MIKPLKMKYLHEVLGLKKNDTVMVTGAGGKTSFCLALCEELKEHNRIIFTTTTKIFFPEVRKNYKIYTGNDFLHRNLTENGAYITGKEENEQGKLLPFSLDEIDSFKEKADYLIIEGDGSRMRPLKGWNKTEPVFVKRTDKTVGVITIRSLGLEINDENIHRLELFLKISGAKDGEYVTKQHLANVINAENGLFKGAEGEKVLLINQADTEKEFSDALELAELLERKGLLPDKIIISSLKEKKYYLLSLQEQKAAVKTGAVIMASGFSRRMGENKLLLEYKGKTFIENTADKVLECGFDKVILVTSHKEIGKIFESRVKNSKKFLIIINKNPDLGLSESIKTGLKELGECDACMFFTGDQPGLTLETIKMILAKAGKNKIIIPKYSGKNGMPTVFGSDFFDELMKLQGDSGGKQIMNSNSESIEYVEISNSLEGFDIDTREDYEYFISKI